MTQPPPPPEAKKSNRLIAVAIVMLLVGVAIGVAVGWLLGQSRSQAVQSEYTRVQVFSGSLAHATLNNYTYTFLYKWWGTYDPQKPIEIDVQGVEKTLSATAGQTYDILGIEVVVSEVHDDYIVLLVRPL